MGLASLEVDAGLAQRIAVARGAHDMESCCSEFAQLLGIEHYEFVLLAPVVSLPRPEPFRVSNFPAVWREKYVTKRFARIDPILRRARDTLTPLFWDEVDVSSSDAEQRYMAAAAAHGLQHGVTVSVVGRTGETSIFTVAGSAPFSASNLDRTMIAIRARSFAATVHEAAIRLDSPKAKVTLSHREKDCLVLTAAGLTTEAIAKKLTIAGRTVLFHLYEASRKMEVHGRHQTLRRAVKVGALDVDQHATERGFDDLFYFNAPMASGRGANSVLNFPNGGRRQPRQADDVPAPLSPEAAAVAPPIELCVWENIQPRLSEFWLAYQPILDPHTLTMVAVEALLRWDNPHAIDAGADPSAFPGPATFVPSMEHTGAICEMGSWVLQQALLQQDTWRKQGLDLTMSVNVSPQQIERPGYAAEVRAALRQHRTSPSRLVLEINETSLVDWSIGTAHNNLASLDTLGVRIRMGDFGSRYTSLSNLRSTHVHGIKIDGSLVMEMDRNKRSRSLVEGFARMATSMGLTVSCEGIESRSIFERLREIGITSAQGFLFSPPVRHEQIPAMASSPHFVACAGLALPREIEIPSRPSRRQR